MIRYALLALLAAPAFCQSIVGTVDNPTGQDAGPIVVYVDGDPGPVGSPVVVRQRDQRFAPDFVALPVGGAIRFENDERQPVDHNVFSRSPLWSVDLGLFGPGAVRQRSFPEAGFVRIYCSVHRHMRLDVFVAPSAHLAVVEGGAFRIDGLRPGRHVVRTWVSNRRLAPAEVEVDVGPGGRSEVALVLSARGRRR